MFANRWSLLFLFHIFVFDLKYSASGLLNLPFTTHTKNEDGSHSTVFKVPFGLGTIGFNVNYDKNVGANQFDSANQNHIQPANTIKNHEDCEQSTESIAEEPLSNNGNSKSPGFLLIPPLPNGFNFKVHLGHPAFPPAHHRTYNCHHHYQGSEPYPRPTYDYYPQQPYPPVYYPYPQQPLYPTQEPKPQQPPYYPTQEPKPQQPPYYPTQEPKPQNPSYYPTQEPNPQQPPYYPVEEQKPQQPSYYPGTQEQKPQKPTYYPDPGYYPGQDPNLQQPSYYPAGGPKPQPQPTYPTNPTNPTYPQKIDPWQPTPDESPPQSVPGGDSSSSPDGTETTPETPSETPETIPTVSVGPTQNPAVDSSSGTVGNQIFGNENEPMDTDGQISPWGDGNDAGASNNSPVAPWGDSNDASASGKEKTEESGAGSLDIRVGSSPGRKPSRNKIQ